MRKTDSVVMQTAIAADQSSYFLTYFYLPSSFTFIFLPSTGNNMIDNQQCTSTKYVDDT